MSDKPIQNCEVRFSFQCPKQWEALPESADPGVRACEQCQKSVYLCQSEQEVLQHARQGHCIAVPSGVLAPKPVLQLRDHPLDPELLRRVPDTVRRKHHLIPLSRRGATLIVAMSDPANTHAIEDVKFLTGYQVEAVGAPRVEIERTLDAILEESDDRGMEMGIVEVVEEPTSSTLVERLMFHVLTTASRQKVQQLRFEATDSALVVRHLVGETLQDVMWIPLKLQEEVLRYLREESGARPGQPGQLQLRVRRQRVLCYRVHLSSRSRGEEVVLQALPDSHEVG